MSVQKGGTMSPQPVDRTEPLILKEQLPGLWFYAVVLLPMALLIFKHGWGESVRDGDMFLLATGVLAAVLAERVKEVSEAQDYKTRDTGIALGRLLLPRRESGWEPAQ